MKQYFTGFFTALCLATSFFLFIGANTGQNEFNKPIVIKGSQGFTYIDGDGIFIASDESKKVKVFFGLDKRDGGMIRLHNSSNKEMAYLGANNESGTLKLNNSNGFETCLISSEDNYGIINLFDHNGKLGYAE